MKKNYTYLLMSFLAVGLMSSNASAQGAYVNVGAGFGFGDGSMSDYNTEYVSTDGVVSVDKQTAVFGSLGSGLNVGAGFGFMFNENFGAELGVNYLIGSTFTTTEDRTTTSTVAGSGGGGSITTTSNSAFTSSMSANMLRINPSLVIMGNGDKIKPYAKFGVMLGFGSATSTDKDVSTTTSTGSATTTSEYNTTMEMTGGIGFGFSGALGAAYGLSDNMSLFAELNMNNMSWAPMTNTITAVSVDGVDQLALSPAPTVFDLQTNYVDEITATSNTYSNPNRSDTSPRDELKSKVGVGSVGINIGLKISF
jgi:hypothetical protein